MTRESIEKWKFPLSIGAAILAAGFFIGVGAGWVKMTDRVDLLVVKSAQAEAADKECSNIVNRHESEIALLKRDIEHIKEGIDEIKEMLKE